MSTPSGCSNFAGRVPAGNEQAVILKKDGHRHTRVLPCGKEQNVLSVGLACSECFSGARLAKILRPGFEYEQQVMIDLLGGKAASPLSNHTSGGVTTALADFVQTLAPHLPWGNIDDLDWCLSLQLEGSSAVWAAIDMLLQKVALRNTSESRLYVAVGETSYHGPPSTSFGSKSPLWKKEYQVKYPVPIAGQPFDANDYMVAFDKFLEQKGSDIGVMLFEPQWGSSQAAFPWPSDVLRECVGKAKEKGIYTVCDEIMCGLGRHGHGTIFVSKALHLDPDAVTFGKAIGAGVFPISGAVMKEGQKLLQSAGKSVMQSHTYAGSSVRALMTATAVVQEVSSWFSHVRMLGTQMSLICRRLMEASKGMLITHGQGLMLGGLFIKQGKLGDSTYRSNAIVVFRSKCDSNGVLPYFVPAGGFMITPLYDIEAQVIDEIGLKLERALLETQLEIGWQESTSLFNDSSKLLPETQAIRPHHSPIRQRADILHTRRNHL